MYKVLRAMPDLIIITKLQKWFHVSRSRWFIYQGSEQHAEIFVEWWIHKIHQSLVSVAYDYCLHQQHKIPALRHLLKQCFTNVSHLLAICISFLFLLSQTIIDLMAKNKRNFFSYSLGDQNSQVSLMGLKLGCWLEWFLLAVSGENSLVVFFSF